LEEQNSLPILYVVLYGAISSHVPHVSALALTEVVKYLVIVPKVCVPMSCPGLTSERDDEWLIFGRADSLALLTSKVVMDVSPTVVKGANDKRKVHGEVLHDRIYPSCHRAALAATACLGIIVAVQVLYHPIFKVKVALSSAARESYCCLDLSFRLAARPGKNAAREGRPLARPAGPDYRSCIHQEV